jgi:hypothetical protein
VVFHSAFVMYVGDDQRRRIRDAIDRAGVYHLRLEPGEGTFEIRLGDELLGTAQAHGAGVRWL